MVRGKKKTSKAVSAAKSSGKQAESTSGSDRNGRNAVANVNNVFTSSERLKVTC